MMSELTEAMIVNGTVLVAVLHSDLGRHKKVGAFRILRPLLMAGGIVPLFLESPVTHGSGLAVELAGVAAGLVAGLAATALMTVHRSPQTGKPVSRTGAAYALLWTLVIGARAAFSYGSVHWFPTQLASWAVAHQVSAAAITDGLIFMAVAMLLTRTIGLGLRAAALPPATGFGSAPRVAAARV
ncbi:hypothetical protein GXW83_31605 [Streptacidiphilus sp. PB12-B1b]|uniref:hypothetical protein n=1 Tax=Streptacidiphilus sp. PB12-B1b TaxID=2705012 RepID=UPI0015F95B4B|nr:hypothetical protein [Streptacidiphilus sp. PB12-B1b]QMU79579.1 hypothetical protein GXW83_31605 [Streptacidiphilus sp. PB12-B1b]